MVSEPEPVLRHVWRLDEDGVRDDFAADSEAIHMGPACTVCGESFCMFCEKDFDSLPCDGPITQSDRFEYAQKEIIRLQAFLAKAEREGRFVQVSETPIPPELCGVGGCVYYPITENEGSHKHSWQAK